MNKTVKLGIYIWIEVKLWIDSSWFKFKGNTFLFDSRQILLEISFMGKIKVHLFSSICLFVNCVKHGIINTMGNCLIYLVD